MPTGTPPPGIPPVDPNGPPLVTALQEQLGLKVEAAKGPVDVLVIDSVEHPTPDQRGSDPQTVVSVVERVRDRIAEEDAISDAEVFKPGHRGKWEGGGVQELKRLAR